MFTLHDQTRRVLTLLIFYLLGPILTFGLIAGVAVRKVSWNARLYERAVAAGTGLALHVGSVEYRTPTCVRFQNVDVLDGATGAPLFHAPAIEWTFVPSEKLGDFFPGLAPEKKGDREERPSLESFVSFFSAILPIRSETLGFHRLTIPQSEIRFETLTPEESAKKTQELLFELLARYRKTPGLPIQIGLDHVDLNLHNSGKRERSLPGSLRFVQGNLYRVADSTRSDWTFQLPEVSEVEMQRFSVEEQPAKLVLRFSNSLPDNHQAYPKEIPCELAAAFCSFFQHFSQGSQFFGDLTAEYRASEPGNPWTFRLLDFFLRNLDVARYAAEYTPFPISGKADIQLYRAAFGSGTFTAEGWLEVRSGSLDRTLFHRLAERFDLRVDPEGSLEGTAVPFDRCVVVFRLDKDGATFWKNNDDGTNRFMVREARPTVPPMSVYLPNTRSPIPYPMILAALVPDTAPIIPLTSGTQKIISVLPTETLPQPVTAPPLPLTAAPR